MLKRMITALAVAALGLALSGVPAQADGGDHRPCVTQREFWEVSKGWRQARVADHFDSHGGRIGYSRSGSGIDTVWRYRKCSPWGPGGWYVGVAYDNYSFAGPYMRVWRKVPSSPAQLLAFLP